MQKVVINVGDKIELTHVRSATRRKLEEHTYTSQLLEYDGLRTAKISMPISGGKIIPLEVNDEYALCFFSSSALYRCRARVIERRREENVYVLMMEFMSLPKKYQRRQFYRLDCTLSVRYRVISDEEKTLRDFLATNQFEDPALEEAYEKKLDEFSRDWQDALMTDISGGGVRFQCQQIVEPGVFVEIAIPLTFDAKNIPFKGIAKVVSRVDLPGENISEERCEFEDISKQDRELIVKYVFEEQKRRLRKESN
nr:flagellar brake protein [Eubacterium sp.]